MEAIHSALEVALPIDDFFICYHDDLDGCDRHKPKPGLMLQAAGKYGVDLRASYLIGDRWRDIDAARAAGCRAIWIDGRYSERESKRHGVGV